jgi:glycosyltransferase involved in cell wall biosynthesis
MATDGARRPLFVSHHYYPNVRGGGEISLKVLSEALVQAGYDVTALAFDGEGEERIGAVHVVRGGRLPEIAAPGQCVRAMATVARLAQTHDLIHIHNLFHLHYVGAYLGRHSKPVLASLNDLPRLRAAPRRSFPSAAWSRLRNHLYLKATRRIPRFVAVSESLKKHYVRHGFQPECISVAPILVDPVFLRPIRPATVHERFRLRFVGSLAARKGVDCLLRAFAKVAVTDDVSELRITGAGPEKNALARLSEELGVCNRVHFDGYVPHSAILRRLDDSDVVIHPGRWPEPFGRAVLEAMARGRPVIVSEQGQPPHTVQDERLVVRSDDPGALAERIQWLRDRPTVREQVGLRLRRRAEEFSASHVVPRLESIYTDLLHRK